MQAAHGHSENSWNNGVQVGRGVWSKNCVVWTNWKCWATNLAKVTVIFTQWPPERVQHWQRATNTHGKLHKTTFCFEAEISAVCCCARFTIEFMNKTSHCCYPYNVLCVQTVTHKSIQVNSIILNWVQKYCTLKAAVSDNMCLCDLSYSHLKGDMGGKRTNKDTKDFSL